MFLWVVDIVSGKKTGGRSKNILEGVNIRSSDVLNNIILSGILPKRPHRDSARKS